MITVKLLGSFHLSVDGRDATGALASSRKGAQLINYLLLSYGKPVSSAALYKALWPGESSTNPENALKTLVSRTRSSLAAVSQELGACISTRRGAYSWNTDLNASIDVLALEKLCRSVFGCESAEKLPGGIEREMCSVYGGDLDVGEIYDSFFAERLSFYHELFVSAALHICMLLKQANRHELIVQLCRSALARVPRDERIHMELMDALLRLGRPNEAYTQFRHADELSDKGAPASPALGAYSARLVRSLHTLDEDVLAVLGELRQANRTVGAYVCEYSVFRDIYQLQLRNLRRLNIPMYLGIIMLTPNSEAGLRTLELDKSMRQLEEVMVRCLRHGDTISRYSLNQFVLLPPNAMAKHDNTVMDRIQATYNAERINPAFVLSYRLVAVEGEEAD